MLRVKEISVGQARRIVVKRLSIRIVGQSEARMIVRSCSGRICSQRLEKVDRALKQHSGGEVEVKTRGGVVDPDVWQKKLQRPASATNERLTVFAIRLGKKRVALISRRVTP